MSCCGEKKSCGDAGTGSLSLSADQLREAVRDHYAEIVTNENKKSPACGNSCFGPSSDPEYAAKLGYTPEELSNVPDGANLGLGCGNPVIFAKLNLGETVVDLGSGAGFDAFIAARKVGSSGRVIGVDMTPQMISKARQNATTNGSKNVEFRLGEIEHLPIPDSTANVIISNCVINLVPESGKAQVFRDSFRILKPGGRICISDVVTSVELPEVMRADLAKYAGCLNGATLMANLEGYLKDAGFTEIRITPKDESKEFIKTWAPDYSVADLIISALIEAKKPE
jgi:arsenite methyltransferase